MSTKIYDAFEFKGNLDELMSYLHQFRKRAVRDGVSTLAKSIEDPYKFDLFEYCDALKKALTSPMFYYQDEKLGTILNVSSSAVVYSYKGRLFVQFFGLPRNVTPRSSRLVDYHYQNQTDPWYDHEQYEAEKRGKPKSKAWMKAQAKNYRERRRVWDAIIGADARPVHCGLVYEFISPADSNEVGFDVFTVVHKHRPGERTKECPICVKRNAERDAVEAIKKEIADAKLEPKVPGGVSLKSGGEPQ